MLTAERKQAILASLERDGRVVASELVASLGVSEDTVRRDLLRLARWERERVAHRADSVRAA